MIAKQIMNPLSIVKLAYHKLLDQIDYILKYIFDIWFKDYSIHFLLDLSSYLII